MKSKLILPPAEEWDFHLIDPVLFSDAAVYEYARTCEKARRQICGWLDRFLVRKKIREHIRSAILATEKSGGDPADFYPPGVWSEIYTSFPQGMTLDIRHVIMAAAPLFPAPWVRLNTRGTLNDGFSRVTVDPLKWTFDGIKEAAEKFGLEKAFNLLSHGPIKDYRLSIDFHADGQLSTIQEIVADFEKWLRSEVRRTKPKMRVGRNAQVNQSAYPLKCLAALRLKNAGFTYDSAQFALAQTKRSRAIPHFANAASWTKAIQFAKKRLGEQSTP